MELSSLTYTFWIISIRLPVPEISSRKEKDNFWSFTISVFVTYSDLSLAPCLADLSQIPDKRQTRFLKERISRKKYRVTGTRRELVTLSSRVIGHFESLYLDNGLRYRDKTKSDFNGMVFSISWTAFDKIFGLFSCVFLYIWKIKVLFVM